MNGHYHWHISFRVPAGYRILDTVPYTSLEACQAGIRRLAWAKDEHPKPHRVLTQFCLAEVRG